ncbi:MAG TPA: Ivy family c-type lysozyme inhibitor [Methyloceanibacter sp.]|nr:Ivy family c-type lysozyme inhibitor [Methyloceanibacter sp.]
MIARLLFAVLLAFAAPALAQNAPIDAAKAPAEDPAKAPPMADLMRLPAYIYAWQGMVVGETPPQWVTDFGATLDGPPTPTIPVPLDGETYTLGFTCKPNDCEANQLYVLFAPQGRDAWGMLANADSISWLGKPDKRIQDAITEALRK